MKIETTNSTAVRRDVSLLGPEDLHLFNEGTHYRIHEKLGAHLTTDGGEAGTCFGVWAPNAREVSVIGSFNHWTPGAHKTIRVAVLASGRVSFRGLVKGRSTNFVSPRCITATSEIRLIHSEFGMRSRREQLR